jgi:putative ABC transport system ATP-binding protein
MNVVRLQPLPPSVRLATAPTVLARGVNHAFDTDTSAKQVLFDIDFTLARGEFVILTGPSGSGKTTLLTLIGALRSLQSGSLKVFGLELMNLPPNGQREIRRKTGFIFQDHNLFDALTAAQTLSLTMQLSGERLSKAAARARAQTLLAQLGMSEYLDAKPGVISVGQKQRIAIARALINNPPLILADEPTAALDSENARLVIDLLKQRTETDGTSVLMVTHDSRAFHAANRIIDMVDGRMSKT